MKHFMILEEGTLVRTKLSVDENAEDFAAAQTQLKHRVSKSRSSSFAWKEINQASVVVDKIQGRGHITGLLHSIYTEQKAYATVVASDECKVWLMDAADFRELCMTNPSHCWQFMLYLSKEVRDGSKSMRTLIRRVKGHINGGGADGAAAGHLRVLCYDATSWVTDNFKPKVDEFNSSGSSYRIVMDYTTDRLGMKSATHAAGYDAVCTFVNDEADAETIRRLSVMGVKMIAQRAAGFDRIDLKAARAYGLTVARVPAYSPYAVAEMAVTLLMAVNRKIHRSSPRVRMGNFSLDSGLMGMDIYGKTVGVMGTGKIGQILCRIMSGFGAKLICYDIFESDAVKEVGGVYVSQEEIFAQSDILFLMMPLLKPTYHTINRDVLPKLKKGMILINTSRGGLIDTEALIEGLRDGIISGVGLDVYENEGEYFFQDWSGKQLKDPILAILLGLNNVVLTAHQAFFTKEAVDEIVKTTINNLCDYKRGLTGYKHPNNVIPPLHSDKER